ncbi:hypothetical protein [Pseudovibrio japonicus]|nr:hypothetical protein [Pseudovibrio japonicus]
MIKKTTPTQKKATVIGMKAGGFYNENSAPQGATIAYVYPWLHEAVAGLDVPVSTSALRFVDFGCSEGANSIQIMNQLVGAAHKHSKRSVEAIHCDLPSNNYTTLLHVIGNREQSPYTDPSVFGGIVAGSIYNQLLPTNSVHVATSFNTVGFFSELPIDRLPGCILPNGPSGQATRSTIAAHEKKIFEEQAQRDLKNFLEVRANELVTGGKLLLQQFARNDQVSTADGTIDALDNALRDHVETREVSQDAYERYIHPVYLRNLDELMEPVKPDSGVLSNLFTLDKTECYEVPIPFVEQFKQDYDAAAYAKQLVNFFRAFSETALQHALVDTPNTASLLDSIYTRAEDLIREAPHLYQFHFISVAMLLTRTERN